VNGYVEAGYIVVLGSLAGYSGALVARERAALRRLPGPIRPGEEPQVSRPPDAVAGPSSYAGEAP